MIKEPIDKWKADAIAAIQQTLEKDLKVEKTKEQKQAANDKSYRDTQLVETKYRMIMSQLN